MNNKYKVARKVLIAFACIVGMSVGVYIIAYPYVTNPIYWNEYSYHYNAKFGADFYTYIYELTESILKQVRDINSNMLDLLRVITTSIGLADIAYFFYKFIVCVTEPITKVQGVIKNSDTSDNNLDAADSCKINEQKTDVIFKDEIK